MVRLTADLIENSRQFINAVKDRELHLRGYKIPAIENMGAAFDQFDTVDFTDNDIRKVDNLPIMNRLRTLLFHNNRINRIADNLHESVPNLSRLCLTNNNIQELGDLEPLTSLPKLEHLTLIGNSVAKKPYYRQYLVYKLPALRVLDYKRIRLAERESARALFRGGPGKELQKKIVKKSAQTFVPGVSAPRDNGKIIPKQPVFGDVAAIKEAINKASSLEEIDRLNQMLASGQIPGLDSKSTATAQIAPPPTSKRAALLADDELEMEEN